ncbi:hypothetical protein F5Y03DRAFT_391945 [Xylaria venustula]|nr:hypothetical protein F5Y03DRAFT_391945 [Xylaria venustula]
MAIHIANLAMDPEQPRPPLTTPLSVPVSTFSTYKPTTFQPTCTHLTMTRVYDLDLTYREHLIVDALGKKQVVTFDGLGSVLCDGVSSGLRSPERRANKLSFLEEITAEQLSTYSPSQVATILKQRDNLLSLVSQEQQASGKAQHLYCPSGSSRRNSSASPDFGCLVPSDSRPWVPRKEDECQAKYCHRCRPSCEPRTYLSLDGIMNGEIPPTVATGFGFHRLGTRPVVDVRFVKDIGLRPVPLPRVEPHIYSSSPSSQSTWTLSDILEDQIGESDFVDSEPCLEPGEGSTMDSAISTAPQGNSFKQHRPAFTPPSTPVNWTGIARQENGTLNFEQCPFVCDGRSPESLKTNDRVRRRVIESIAGIMDQEPDKDEMEKFQSICSFRPATQSILLGASLASLAPQMSGDNDDQRGITPMMMEELEEGRFHDDPLNVRDGVAILEESIELGVPDFITKM